MTRQELREELAGIIENDVGVRHDDLQDETSIREGLGLDSVDVVSVISQMERKFKIRIDQDELVAMTTVGQFLDVVQTKIAGKAQAA